METVGNDMTNTMMDTFDGSLPNLISAKTIKDIEAPLSNLSDNVEGNKVINGLGNFYSNYISPNLFPLIVIGLLVLYLTIKYVLKKDREEKEDIEIKQEIKKKKVKKMMVRVDPDEMIIRNKISETPEKVGIADMISDDYLITDDQTVAKNTDQMNHAQFVDHNANNVNFVGQNANDNNDDNADDINSIHNIDTMAPTDDMNNLPSMATQDNPYDVDRASKLIFG
jgi:hypothetical protein